jgi:hypothetical protein
MTNPESVTTPLISNALQDVLAIQFNNELKFGKENWADGTHAKLFGRDAERTLDAMLKAGERGGVTYSHLLLAGTYAVLATEDQAVLRENLTHLTAQLVQWIEKLDRVAAK